MKCLSVRQPWANLIISGAKGVENRSWSTGYRGPLYIHAPRMIDKNAEEKFKDIISAYPLGAIIGQVDLVDVMVPEQGFVDPWYEPGCYGWIFKNPKRFQPHPYRGEGLLFDVSLELGKY